jgi:hypothetical protein
MKKILQYEAEDGTPLLIEVNDTVTEATRGSDERGVIQNAKESFDKALKPLKDVSNSIVNCIKDITHSPEEVEVELGLKFTAKAGIILTSLDSEAHLKVVFKWKNEKNNNNNTSPVNQAVTTNGNEH